MEMDETTNLPMDKDYHGSSFQTMFTRRLAHELDFFLNYGDKGNTAKTLLTSTHKV